MSKKEKLIEKVLALSTDVSFDEIVIFLRYFGFILSNKGKTSGSRVIFEDKLGIRIYMHKPHPTNNVKNSLHS